MKSVFRYMLITAFRDRIYFSVLIMIAIVASIAFFLGENAMIEKREMAVVLIAGSSRFIAALGLMVFIAVYMQSLFDNKEYEAILSRPITHGGFVFAIWGALAIMAILLCLPVSIIIALLINNIEKGFFIWSLSFAVEGIIVAAIALFCSLGLRKASSAVLASTSLYILARLSGFFIIIAERQVYLYGKNSDIFIKNMMEALATIVPRLDLFARTNWLVNNNEPEISMLFIVVQGVIYIALVLAATTFDMKRKSP